MSDILNWVITISQQYLIDLGVISSNAAQTPLLSSVSDYTQKVAIEPDEKLEKLKKKPILEKLEYIYGDNTFTGRYGIDIVKVCFVIFIFIACITYFKIQNTLLEVKRDWPEYRCRPDVMPFAGLINAPDGVGAMEYTKQNFMECTAKTTENVFSQPMSMVYVIFNVIMNIFKNILEVIERFRQLFNKMRDALKDIFITVFYRIQNMLIPIQNMLIKMVDFFEKIKGILATFLLTMIGVLWTLYSLIGSIYELIIFILVIMVVVIVVLWYIPFVGWALAIAAIAVFLTIAIPLIMLGMISRQITHQRRTQIPGP